MTLDRTSDALSVPSPTEERSLEQTVLEPQLNPGMPHCDCTHEKLTDGIHHYLDLPGETDENGNVPIDETLEHTDGYYIAVAFSISQPCFMRPAWAATFRGPSEAGEIPPSLRLLCDWCKNHWSNAPQVQFRSL